MTKLKRPLDRKAVLIANDAIRSETGGRQLTMEPKDAPLRKKWREAYIKAAGKNAQTATSDNKSDVNSPIEKCPKKSMLKWIKIRLFRKKRNLEHSWWPKDVVLSYRGEAYEVQLTNGNRKGNLSQQGNVEFINIPAGSNTFKCPSFYHEIEKWMDEKLK
jgi:hypothetical protein